MPSVYDISRLQAEALYLLESVFEAEDQQERESILAEVDALIESAAAELPDKLDALRAVTVRLSSMETEARAEAKRMTERARVFAGQVKRVRGMATDLLVGQRNVDGEGKVKTSRASYWLATSKRVVGPEDVTAWVAEGWYRADPKADRKEAANALAEIAEGNWPEGFGIEVSESVRWR